MYYRHKNTTIKYMNKNRDEIFTVNHTSPQIVFLLKGKVTYSYGNLLNRVFEESTFILLPVGYNAIIRVEEASTLLFVSIPDKLDFCNRFRFKSPYNSSKSHNADCALKINWIIANYVDLLIQTIKSGLKSTYLNELKQKELLFYIKTYYPKEDLLDFFASMLNCDISFSELIYQNIDKAKSLEEFAKLTDYSLSGFKKKFVRVFGMPPYQWLTQEKAKKVYHEINCTDKSFTKISSDFDFSSPAHFDIFCKKMFGASPKTIRLSNNFM